MNGVVDLFDVLRPVRAEGGAGVHLAPNDWDQSWDATLCGLRVAGLAAEPIQVSGCLRCAVRAVGSGIYGVRESDSAVVNLARFIDSRMPEEP